MTGIATYNNTSVAGCTKKVRVLFVCVIYKQKLSESAAVQGLRSLLPLFDDYHGLIVNNPPDHPQVDETIQDRLRHVATGLNQGLAVAYNFGLSKCYQHDFGYLGLLDQDSSLTRDYINALDAALKEPQDHDIVAWVPSIKSHRRLISPYYHDCIGIPHYAYNPAKTSALNSFTVFRADYLQSTGGFDSYYWLDGLDTKTFFLIRAAGKKCALLPTTVNHDLSLLGPAVSSERLTNIARYESAYLAECASFPSVITGVLRLLVRALLKKPPGSRPSYFAAYLSALWEGLRAGRARRRKQYVQTNDE